VGSGGSCVDLGARHVVDDDADVGVLVASATTWALGLVSFMPVPG